LPRRRRKPAWSASSISAVRWFTVRRTGSSAKAIVCARPLRAALWLRQYAESTGFPAVELRLFSVYGPGEGPHRFIPTLLRAAITGERMPLVAGPKHDFIYVEDVLDACLCATRVATAPGAVFNIGSGVSRANQEVVEMARQVTGRPIPIAEAPHSGSPSDRAFWCADISAARERLAWAPRHSLPEGLAATYHWMRRSR
jgi:nucleoside-diphosphate-sugar epimerase